MPASWIRRIPSCQFKSIVQFHTVWGKDKAQGSSSDEEMHQRLNLHISISSALESVRFTLPESTVDGEPILPSPYLKSVLESSRNRSGREEGRQKIRIYS